MKYYLITFGCQMNKSDSERIAAVLEKIGYQKATNEKEADLILVNMCSVRQSAVDRVYGLAPKIKKLKEKNPKIKTILTGCVLKEDKNKFAKFFDYVLSIKTLPKWDKILKQTRDKLKQFLLSSKDLDYLKIKPKYSTKDLAFVPISIGCNNFCSYCVVPYTRGPLICRDHKEILKEVKELIKKGYKEIWLLGQNVNDYQSPIDRKINFPKLLEKIDGLRGNFKFFFLSSNPKNFSDELIEVLSKSKHFGGQINLPVQSGDDEILKKMNRPYTVKEYERLIKKIKNKIPDVKITTDIIVGFPGETKKQFENTLKLLKKIKFDKVFVAKYSPRPGTLAFKFKDEVPQKEKIRRWQIVNEMINKKGLTWSPGLGREI